MKIAVDAMGGDNAPKEIIKGALEAAREFGQQVILVGRKEKIRDELSGDINDLVELVDAPEVISMDEHPAVAVRRKRNSSIVKAVQLIKEGKADAVVSAGSTGAAMAAAVLELGVVKGIDRPAITTLVPGPQQYTAMLDVGANVDCKPHHLLQFGIMGHLYAEKILYINNPRVGLLNIGEEETKGNELTLAAFPLLQKAGINFTGNVEGRDILNGKVDVVVCDGFVGNIVLKTMEGMINALFHMLKEEVAKSVLAKLGLLMFTPALRDFQRRFDYAEYGGAPLLGVNGVIIICHGSSASRAIKNAIQRARESVKNGLVLAIQDSILSGQKAGWINV